MHPGVVMRLISCNLRFSCGCKHEAVKRETGGHLSLRASKLPVSSAHDDVSAVYGTSE